MLHFLLFLVVLSLFVDKLDICNTRVRKYITGAC